MQMPKQKQMREPTRKGASRRRSLGLLLGLALAMEAGLPATPARAGADVAVHVDVVKGSKGGSGMDKKCGKHEGVLGRVAGYGGWSLAEALDLKVELGKAVVRDVGPRKFSVGLDSLSADKAKVTLVVTDPNGKEHKVTSSMGRGATQVLTSQSSDGGEVHLFIVTVSY